MIFSHIAIHGDALFFTFLPIAGKYLVGAPVAFRALEFDRNLGVIPSLRRRLVGVGIEILFKEKTILGGHGGRIRGMSGDFLRCQHAIPKPNLIVNPIDFKWLRVGLKPQQHIGPAWNALPMDGLAGLALPIEIQGEIFAVIGHGDVMPDIFCE